MADINYADLDPGIRDVVRLLQAHGFDTCDSGDGRSKFEGDDAAKWADCANREPHVVCLVPGASLVAEADRLLAVLRAEGVAVDPQGPDGAPGVYIQATYDPARPDASLVFVAGLDAAGLAAARAAR